MQPGSKFVLTADGIVGAEVGRTWSEVSAAFEAEGGYDPEFADDCQSYAHRGGKFDAMVVGNTIVRVEVSGPDVRTAKGVGIGSSLAELKQAYGNRLIAEKNPYEGEDVQYVWQSEDRGLVFYMSDGKVRFMAGGGDAIRLPEGCH